MHTIPKNKDKIDAIQEYLIANRLDNEGDSWIFGHHPIIEEHLLSFTKVEAQLLESRIQKWDESEQYKFADPIANTKNKMIDGIYLYGQIFLTIQDFEKLEYLIQNLVMIVWDSNTKRPIEFYESILEKAKLLNQRLDNGYINLISSIEQKIKREQADNSEG